MKNVLALIFLLLSWLFYPVNHSIGATLTGEIARVHDPSRMVECEGKYYIYLTGVGIPSRVSDDGIRWEVGAPVLTEVPDWMKKLVPKADGKFIWAPDVIRVRDEYWLFYSYSTFGSQISAIGLLSNVTLDPKKPDYKWQDRGLVIATNGTQNSNAIDAAPIFDSKGELWLSYGSWNRNGILIVPLDAQTGKPTGAPQSIAAGQATGPEAPYLHFRDGYYYLFENEGHCCRGLNSTYKIMMGRSRDIRGPYLDKTGKRLDENGGSVFLESAGALIGPGHVGIWSDGAVEKVTFHFYDGQKNGVPTLAMRDLVWDANAWPIAAPAVAGGRTAIISRASGLALGVQNRSADDGAPLDQFAFSGDIMQSWNIVPLGDGYYGISSITTGKWMELFECSAQDGTKISQYPWKNNDCQRWRIEAVAPDVYRLISKGGGTALTLPNDAATPRVAMVGEAWKGASGQMWELRPLS